MICVIVFVLICQVCDLNAQSIGPFQRSLLYNENQLGLLSTVQNGPSFKTMVIYNELMRNYYEVVKRYLDYKNRNMSTINIQNPEFRYLEEILSSTNENDLRGLLGIFGTIPVSGQGLFGNFQS